MGSVYLTSIYHSLYTKKFSKSLPQKSQHEACKLLLYLHMYNGNSFSVTVSSFSLFMAFLMLSLGVADSPKTQHQNLCHHQSYLHMFQFPAPHWEVQFSGCVYFHLQLPSSLPKLRCKKVPSGCATMFSQK